MIRAFTAYGIVTEYFAIRVQRTTPEMMTFLSSFVIIVQVFTHAL